MNRGNSANQQEFASIEIHFSLKFSCEDAVPTQFLEYERRSDSPPCIAAPLHLWINI